MNESDCPSATALARRQAAGEASARAELERRLVLLERLNPRLNAVVIRCDQTARAEAAAADEAARTGQSLGRLHGVPITVKECFGVQGTDSTAGLPTLVGKTCRTDGPQIAALRRAGAVLMGKTNLSQLMLFHECDNPVYGLARNPWDAARTPGGSSGGEAAALAAGLSCLGLGSDIGGSIRVPAHFCGVHALKPTPGRVTLAGSINQELFTGQEAVADAAGPMARRVEDLATAMRVLADAAPGDADPSQPPLPIMSRRDQGVDGLSIGFYEDNGWFAAAPAVRRAVRSAADVLARRGCRVTGFRPPDTDTGMQLYFALLTADGGDRLWRRMQGGLIDRRLRSLRRLSVLPVALRPLLAALLRAGGQRDLSRLVRHTGPRNTSAYWDLVAEARAWRQRFLTAMKHAGVDVLLSPPHALPALIHGASEYLAGAASYAMIYNLLGMPAGVVSVTRVRDGEESDRRPGRDFIQRQAQRVEMGSAGLPIGVQVAARQWQDARVLSVMAELERGFAERPDYPLGMQAGE
ncbi:MAG: amidase family protein [Aquisalimonadaceae bacterium]